MALVDLIFVVSSICMFPNAFRIIIGAGTFRQLNFSKYKTIIGSKFLTFLLIDKKLI